MSGMHWAKRNKEAKRWHPLQANHRRLPGWKDRPGPFTFKKYFPGHASPDAVSKVVSREHKARVTLPRVSILEDHHAK